MQGPACCGAAGPRDRSGGRAGSSGRRLRRGDPAVPGRLAFLEQAEQAVQQAGASFHEIVLLDSKENAIRRFAERTRRGADPAQADAQEMIDRRGGREELSAMYDRLMSVIATRPAAHVVPTSSSHVEQAYQDFLRSLT